MRKIFTLLLVFVLLTSAVSAVTFSDFLEDFKRSLTQITGKAVSSGKILELNFDEGTGNIAYDTSGNNYHGTISGATWIKGIKGKALNFDGVDDIVTSNLDYSNLHTFTLVAWIKPIETGSFKPVIGLKYGNNIEDAMVLNNYKLCFHDNPGKLYDKRICSRNDVIVMNKWNFVTLTYDNGNVRIFHNGIKVGEGILIKDDSPGTLLIGRVYNHLQSKYSGRIFKGVIDKIKVYNKALTASEIKDLYNGYVTEQCRDSDNGKNYYVKGTTTGYYPITQTVKTFEDTCNGYKVMEYYCSYINDPTGGAGYVNYTVSSCPNSCKDGACIRETIPGVLYITDFSVDPEWETNKPENYYWDSTTETYHAYMRSNLGEYGTIPINWNVDSSFTLEFDLGIVSRPRDGDLLFGIYDSDKFCYNNVGDAQKRANSITALYGGYENGMSLRGADYEGTTFNAGITTNTLVLNKWYHNTLSYDKDLGKIVLVIRPMEQMRQDFPAKREPTSFYVNGTKYSPKTRTTSPQTEGSNEIVLSVDNIEFSFDIVNLGFSAVGGAWVSNGREAEAYVDNIKFYKGIP